MGFTLYLENSLLKLLFTGVGITNLADNATTMPATTLYASLHSGSPGIAGTQNTNEVNYTNYLRVAIQRNSLNWIFSAQNIISPVNNIIFPVIGNDNDINATYVGIGLNQTGTGTLLMFGALNVSLPCVIGTTPVILAQSAITLS